jgi:hypothetical protein
MFYDYCKNAMIVIKVKNKDYKVSVFEFNRVFLSQSEITKNAYMKRLAFFMLVCFPYLFLHTYSND